ncbi:hypothetical protein PHLGIDRAFT_37628 [Phlebiopsis gigantea 11061_1 CR5-6]|uniref:Uncharacterized protein n=1 Tax=Phlebiopsis gigantea (strain 11061_1 CR5-6) TaxID=745531 RepID=A0A0C3NEH6_PHLG1|nr:hypothetical protein PHLGIDRAFT_37628 [Phlebiopsis gigantea 11061_1 CR5-6]
MSRSRGASASSVSTTSDPQHGGGEEPVNRPLLEHMKHTQTTSGPVQGTSRYGAVDSTSISVNTRRRPSRQSSPEIRRQDSLLNRVPEEEFSANVDEEIVEDPEEVEWSLGERGLYSGSYRRIVAMHTFVPVVSLSLLAFLFLSPHLFWKYRSRPPEAHPPYFPSPLPELILSSSVWALAYLLRTPIFSVVSFFLDKFPSAISSFFFNASHVLVYNFFRLAPLPILRIREHMQYSRASWHDSVFYRVWWLSLGWATIDVAVSIWQSYTQLSLYRSVMVPEERVLQVLASDSALGSASNLLSPADEVLPLSPRQEMPKTQTPRTLDDAIRLAVDQDLEQLVNLKEREEVEEVYGLPVIKIPVFVSCLLRVDSILLSTGITMTLAAAYLNSSLSLSVANIATPPRNNRPLLIALPLIVLLNLFLNLIHTPLILPRIGVHRTAYICFVLGLGMFFIGLGSWGALA